MAYVVVTLDVPGMTTGTLKDKGLSLGNPLRSLAGLSDLLQGAMSKSFSSNVKVEVQGELTEDVITEGYYDAAAIAAYSLSTTDRSSIVVIDTPGVPAVASSLASQGLTLTAIIPGIAGDLITFQVIDTTAGGLGYTETMGEIIVDLGGDVVSTSDVVTLLTTTFESSYVTVVETVPGAIAVAAQAPLAGGADEVVEVSHLEYFVNNNNPESETFNLK